MGTKLKEDERSKYGGSAYDQQFFTDDELRKAAEIRAAAEAGETSWQSAHDYVEGIRNKYGYSGGTDGSQYSAVVQPQKVSTVETPNYVSRYQDTIDQLRSQIMNRDPFSYDYQKDPGYQAYAKEYVREGRRATEDTLGQLAAMTGGMPSTAAVTAAQQAGDYYNSKLADSIPALRELAYQMYQAEGNQMNNNLNTLLQLESMDYGKYQDQLAQANYLNELALNANNNAVDQARQRVDNYLAMGGSLAGLDKNILAQSGYSQSELSAMESYYKNQLQAKNAVKAAVKTPQKEEEVDDSDATIANQHGDSWVYIPGHGRFSYAELEALVDKGDVIETYDKTTNSYSYKWKSNR